MEVVGGGTALEYGPEDEGPHTPGNDEFWQESVVLYWWDQRQNIGGFHRIGHEVNRKDGPRVTFWNNIFTPDCIFKRDVELPLREGDRPPNGFNCGDDSCTFEYTDHAIWKINEADVKAELHVHDEHTPIDIYPKTGALGTDVAPNHMEVGAKVTGTLLFNGKEYQVNGLAFRDHGWGVRHWDTFVSHRWIAGVGEGFSFLALTFHSSDDVLARFGCLIRDHKLTYASEVDVVAYLEPDGLTHRGGYLDMTLTTGEQLHIECTPLQKGLVSWIHGIACVDTLCKVKMGDLEGICDFEMTNNAQRGSHRPAMAINGVVDNGMNKV